MNQAEKEEQAFQKVITDRIRELRLKRNWSLSLFTRATRPLLSQMIAFTSIPIGLIFPAV
jgi:hypothetical protein